MLRKQVQVIFTFLILAFSVPAFATAPTVSLSVDVTNLGFNLLVEAEWSSTNATSCVGDLYLYSFGQFILYDSVPLATSGTASAVIPNAIWLLVVTCTGSGGSGFDQVLFS